MTRSISPRLLGWGAAAALLALPLVAGAPWTPADYAFAAGMLGIAGGAIEIGARASTSLAYRGGTAIAVVAAFLVLWVNAAVGFFGSEDNDVNAIFGLTVLVAVVGTLLAGLRARGVAWAMLAAAATQLLVGLTGLAAGWAAPGLAGIRQTLGGTAFFCVLWLASAALFARAAPDFAWRLAAAGIPMAWVGGAMAYHQHHAVHIPPLHQFGAILRNATRFRARWGRWCMDYWLGQFADMHLIRWSPDTEAIELLREPTAAEVAASRREDALFS